MNKQITITENASKQILYLINKENKSDLYFRIKVDGGGCAGFQYNFTFTDIKDSKDLVLLQNNVKVIVDDVSLNLIKGSTLDYVKELIGSSFKIENPQATSSCGCGTSFSI
tara:strand:+ start:282 stop:614 length:333 start_codon:yes stop_codon:yes gene_type:complete